MEKGKMELRHFSHEHPLVFNEERSNESQKVYCSGCGELVSGPSFSCEECGYYLDKMCADAPSEMNHPFHQNHSLSLLVSSPYQAGCITCDLCDKRCDNFIYHCSCELDLHIKCAFLSKDFAEKRFEELEDIPHKDPLTSPENRFEVVKEDLCFICYKPLSNAAPISLDFGFRLHKKCVDLPTEINHFCHIQHPLFLQFSTKHLLCQICQKTKDNEGFVYCCSHCEIALHIACVDLPNKIDHPSHTKHPLILQIVNESLPCQICQEANENAGSVYYCSVCKFSLHIECASPPPPPPPPIIETKSHQHQFILFWRRVPFICDACGTPGRYVSYICSTCSLIIHKKCISLPQIIKFYRHEHPIVHTYFLEEHGSEMWECRFCHEEVKNDHGSYFCSECNYIVHVNCALKESYLYKVVDSIEKDEAVELAFQHVTTASIKHVSHDHNLELSEHIEGDQQCDGCLLFISTTYYFCSQCDFFLHKTCAELPLKKHLWFHYCQKLNRLTSGGIYRCDSCKDITNAFAYTCDECETYTCLRCALTSDIAQCEGHEHLLRRYHNYEVSCNACGDHTIKPYRCKSCNFNLEGNCLRLPLIARNKYDKHLFKLTYHENNNYEQYHYCDICEEGRNPNHWFYHCAICDNSAHLKCVLGDYSFIKLGSIYTKGDHQHPLTFVQKVELYPECHICGELCFDLALECKATHECNYIVHWECIKPWSL